MAATGGKTIIITTDIRGRDSRYPAARSTLSSIRSGSGRDSSLPTMSVTARGDSSPARSSREFPRGSRGVVRGEQRRVERCLLLPVMDFSQSDQSWSRPPSFASPRFRRIAGGGGLKIRGYVLSRRKPALRVYSIAIELQPEHSRWISINDVTGSRMAKDSRGRLGDRLMPSLLIPSALVPGISGSLLVADVSARAIRDINLAID